MGTNKNIKQIVIATGNEDKLREIKSIFENFKLEVLSMKDVGLENLEIIEDGNTFEENALIKAKVVMERTGKLSIADDSGLEVEALNCEPGIYSARFAGELATDEDNNDKLLKELDGIALENRKARFVCAIAAIFPNGESIVVRGQCEGKIGFELKGKEGFGYDPLFIVDGYDKTFGELENKIKNKISHRAKALSKLKKELKNKMVGE